MKNKILIKYYKMYIYKITPNDLSLEFCYVGSTINFNARKNLHKSKCKKCNKLLYSTIKANGGWDKWTIEVVEELPTETTIQQLRLREEELRIELHANLNHNRCIINKEQKREYAKEYRIAHKDYYNKYNEFYRNKNKEYYKEYGKKYREARKVNLCK